MGFGVGLMFGDAAVVVVADDDDDDDVNVSTFLLRYTLTTKHPPE